MRGSARGAYAALVVLALVWGYNWVAIKVATAGADAFLVAAIRSVVATLVLFAALRLSRRSLRPPPFGPTLTLGILQTSLFTLLQVLAVAAGGAGKTAILVFTMPFWVVLFAGPLLHERLTRTTATALIVAAAGLALVLAPFDATGLSAKVLAVCAAIVWAASVVYGKMLRAAHVTDLLNLTSWQMLYGTIPLMIVAAVIPHRPIVASLNVVLGMAYVALFGTALAWLLWMFILSRLSAGVAGIASLLTPVIGVFAAWLQLGERPGALELTGLSCIVIALIVNALPAGSRSGGRVIAATPPR